VLTYTLVANRIRINLRSSFVLLEASNRIRMNFSCVREIGLGSTMIPAKKKESNKADFAFDPEGGRQEDVGEVQAFHLLLMLLRYLLIDANP
jgi:hypothetical protein